MLSSSALHFQYSIHSAPCMGSVMMEGDAYIGGDTFMDHGGRACFLLLKHEAAVWTTYDVHATAPRAAAG
jgi:hypothetical protein